jgi:hypothetical protein
MVACREYNSRSTPLTIDLKEKGNSVLIVLTAYGALGPYLWESLSWNQPIGRRYVFFGKRADMLLYEGWWGAQSLGTHDWAQVLNPRSRSLPFSGTPTTSNNASGVAMP